jgi:DNA-directed RNA polymerase subunit omega
MSSMPVVPEGITNPPIDDLLAVVDSKYALVIYAAKRARQINAYYSQLGEGLLEYVGPLVETHVQEKPLSVALREIDAGLLTIEPDDGKSTYMDGTNERSVDLSAAEMFGTDLPSGAGEARVDGAVDGDGAVDPDARPA